MTSGERLTKFVDRGSDPGGIAAAETKFETKVAALDPAVLREFFTEGVEALLPRRIELRFACQYGNQAHAFINLCARGKRRRDRGARQNGCEVATTDPHGALKMQTALQSMQDHSSGETL